MINKEQLFSFIKLCTWNSALYFILRIAFLFCWSSSIHQVLFELTYVAIKYLTLTLFVIVSLFLSFASTNSITKLDSKISATATATTTELNNTGSKEGSFANMIDHALEKKFNKSEQNEGLY